jgi:CBS domain-containing protein
MMASLMSLITMPGIIGIIYGMKKSELSWGNVTMQVEQILKAKSNKKLFSVYGGSTVNEAVKLLSSKRVGSVVVLDENDGLVGIYSERDTISAIAAYGPNCLESTVNKFMTKTVETCSPTDQGDEILKRMTEGRFRHMPVMENGELVGMITIGDIVKSRLDTLVLENEAMQNMITGY